MAGKTAGRWAGLSVVSTAGTRAVRKVARRADWTADTWGDCLAGSRAVLRACCWVGARAVHWAGSMVDRWADWKAGWRAGRWGGWTAGK